ncbi:DNA-3-methyladenine glycosylase family protein [Chitinophaga pinensis]|uniref:DNA-3-methyladenine glycosylase II n=1 Tax=Chitinophaga pinensis TaxID=79329 RepID=A0A5C6LJV6_9BACT|nr:DNA glycosylase [Chitinophaga pinensis]TWV94719.1 DNA-3-methyladenine glycosylase 2 family protein [Chitinophaga pinensis]
MKKSRLTDIPVTDHDNFSFAECLVFLSRSEKECLHYVQGNVVHKMMVSNGHPVLLEISDDPAAKALKARVLDGGDAEIDEAHIRRYISHWLHLETDLRPFYKFAKKDVVLKPLADRYKGLRLIGIPDLFEALTWSITGQQINLGFAYTLRQRFIHAFGHHAVIAGKDYYVYPHPAVVASLEPASLMAMQFSRSKADYIIGLAKAMTDGLLTDKQLWEMDYQQARTHLISFRGIGNWSANYVLMKYHRHHQALPLEDAGLHNALKQQMQLTTKPSLTDVKEYTQHWGEYAAYATFYLWRSLMQ